MRILDKSGLTRTQQGKALVLTVHGFNEEIKMEDVGKLPHTDIAKLYTVRYAWSTGTDFGLALVILQTASYKIRIKDLQHLQKFMIACEMARWICRLL